MTPIYTRLEIYAEDIMLLRGKKRKAANRVINKIRQLYDLGTDGAVTIYHLARFYKNTVAEIEERMRIIYAELKLTF